jgi:hypothetical protein
MSSFTEEIRSFKRLVDQLCHGSDSGNDAEDTMCKAGGALGVHCGALSQTLDSFLPSRRGPVKPAPCVEAVIQQIDKHMQAMSQLTLADPKSATFSLSILTDFYIDWRKEVKKNLLAKSQLGESARPYRPKSEKDKDFVSFKTLVGAENEKQRLEEGLRFPLFYPLLFPNRPRGVLLYGSAGGGKCWGVDTKLMLFDGRSKLVQDIVAGDQLMGDDNTPRTVQEGSVIRGHTGQDQEQPAQIMPVRAGKRCRTADGVFKCKYDGCPITAKYVSALGLHESKLHLHTIAPAVKPAMYRITSNNDGRDTWTCNESHILVLKHNERPSTVQKRKEAGISTPWRYSQFEVVNGTIIDRNVSFKTQEEAQQARDHANANWQPLVWEGPVHQFLRLSPYVQSRLQMFQPSLVRFGITDKPLREVIRDAMRAEQTPGSEDVSFDFVTRVAWAIGVWLADGITGEGGISQIKEYQQNPEHAHTAVVEQLKLVYELLTGKSAGQDEVPPKVENLMNNDESTNDLLEYHADEEMAGLQEAVAAEEILENNVDQIGVGIVRFASYSSAGNAAYVVRMGAVFRRILRAYEIFHSKKFPHALLSENEYVRRALFAGVIDGDGHADQRGKTYEVAAKERVFIDGLIHLSRGLGFSTGKVGKTSCTNEQTGQVYTGFRIHIGGADLWKDVPTVLAYKRMGKSTPNKDQRCDGFKVELIEHSAYYGFTLDGNGRCLMDDFVVTHNTKLMQALAWELRKTTAFFFPQPDQLLGRYVGQTESNIVALYTAATDLLRSGKKRAYQREDDLPPAQFVLIFVDEGEGILGSGREEDASKQRTVNTFLQQMDGANSDKRVVTAVATNFPHAIDSAILRRLQLKILVDQPLRAARINLIRNLLRQRYSWPGEANIKGQENAWLDNIKQYGWKPLEDVRKVGRLDGSAPPFCFIHEIR